jgi:hypothetical protein
MTICLDKQVAVVCSFAGTDTCFLFFLNISGTQCSRAAAKHREEGIVQKPAILLCSELYLPKAHSHGKEPIG